MAARPPSYGVAGALAAAVLLVSGCSSPPVVADDPLPGAALPSGEAPTGPLMPGLLLACASATLTDPAVTRADAAADNRVLSRRLVTDDGSDDTGVSLVGLSRCQGRWVVGVGVLDPDGMVLPLAGPRGTPVLAYRSLPVTPGPAPDRSA